jgi:FtsZ-interacting cell division protein YlmF
MLAFKNFTAKVKDYFVNPDLDDDADYAEDYYDEEEEQPYDDFEEPVKPSNSNTAKNQRQAEKYIHEVIKTEKELYAVTIKEFDEVCVIGEHIKNQHICIINLCDTEPRTAGRITAFLYGTAYCQQYHVDTVVEGVLIFAPYETAIEKTLYRTPDLSSLRRKAR